MINRKSIIVLFGGVSSEHEVSCSSAASILKNIDYERWNVYKVGIAKDGRWLLTTASPSDIESGAWVENVNNEDVTISVNRNYKGLYVFKTRRTLNVDCIFPIMHGLFGEDGTIQGLCEVAGIPYVGCNVSASVCSLDKVLTKKIVKDTSIKQADFLSYQNKALEFQIKEIKEYFAGRYPIFVKPAKEGSSIGISKVVNETEIEKALIDAFYYDNKVLVEEGIVGREIEVAVLGYDYNNLITSNVGEIIVENGFYSYASKYGDEEGGVISAKTRIIEDLDDELVTNIQNAAKTVYVALGCQGLSRVDFFLTNDNQIIFNEINTMPGFTNISMYPKLIENIGINYKELISILLESAIYEHEAKK